MKTLLTILFCLGLCNIAQAQVLRWDSTVNSNDTAEWHFPYLEPIIIGERVYTFYLDEFDIDSVSERRYLPYDNRIRISCRTTGGQMLFDKKTPMYSDYNQMKFTRKLGSNIVFTANGFSQFDSLGFWKFVVYNQNGELARVIRNPYTNHGLYDLSTTEDSCLVYTGPTGPSLMNTYAYAAKIDHLGNVIWYNEFPSNFFSMGSSVQALPLKKTLLTIVDTLMLRLVIIDSLGNVEIDRNWATSRDSSGFWRNNTNNSILMLPGGRRTLTRFAPTHDPGYIAIHEFPSGREIRRDYMGHFFYQKPRIFTDGSFYTTMGLHATWHYPERGLRPGYQILKMDSNLNVVSTILIPNIGVIENGTFPMDGFLPRVGFSDRGAAALTNAYHEERRYVWHGYDFMRTCPITRTAYYDSMGVEYFPDRPVQVRASMQEALSARAVFPNPSAGEVNIQLPIAIEPRVGTNFTLQSANGKQWQVQGMQVSANQYRLDISNLASGLYILKLQAGGKMYYGKVVKSE